LAPSSSWTAADLADQQGRRIVIAGGNSGSRSMDSVWGLRRWARSAAGIEVMTTEQADAFEAQFADVRQSFPLRDRRASR
jgi:hypothetical protein